MIDREALRADMAARREEIARRQAELDVDPRVTTRAARAPLIYKTHWPETNIPDENITPTVTEPEPFSDLQMDIVAGAMAELRRELTGTFEARIAKLEGQISTLLTLLSGDTNKSVTPLRLTGGR